VLTGEVEGFEFILNAGATHYYSNSTEIFHKYDLHKTIQFLEYKPPIHIKIIDARSSFEAKHLLFDEDDFAIINKYSAKGYLETLNKMNNAISLEIIDFEAKNAKIIKQNFEDIFFGLIKVFHL